MASPKPTSASAIISALKEYGIEFTPAREKALLKTINTLFKTKSSEEVSTYVATKVAFITKQLKAIGLDTGLGDADGNGKISATELAALKAEIKGSVKTAADTGVGPGDGTTNPTTLTITGDKTSATEGKDTVTYTVKGTAGAVYTWTVDDNHVNDVVTAAGTVTIGTNGEGTFTVVAKQDNLTESAEVVKVTLLDNNAAAVANANLIIQEDPGAAAALSVDATSITEGGAAATFTVTGLVGATYTWTVDSSHVGDFDSSGNVVTLVAGPDGKGTATFTVKAKQDNTAESAEVTTISILDGTGVVVATRSLTIVEDPLVGQTFTLTTGVDTVAGGAANDTINGTNSTITGLDSIDGGAGTGDKFVIESVGALAISPTDIDVKNVEIATIRGTAGVTVNASKWTGLTDLNVTQASFASLTAAATTAVNTAGTTGNVTIAGGLTQTVNATAAAVTLSGSKGAVSVTHTAQANNSILVNDGTTVTVNATDVTSGTITVGTTTAPTGAVKVTSAGNYTDGTNITLGNIVVKGGSTVEINQTAGLTATEITAAESDATNFTVTQGAVSVTGTVDTTAVTVIQEAAQAEKDYLAIAVPVGNVGIANGAVTIADVNAADATKAGSIAAVTLTNFGAATVNSSALATLNLSGTGTSVAVTQGALTTPAVTTQALNVNGLTTTGAVTLDADIATLNIASSTADSKLASLVAAGASTVNVSGDALLTLTAQTLTAATAITVTNTAGATFGSTLAVGTAFTGGAGVETITLGATTKAITTGAGNDVVNLAAGTVALGAGGSIDAGDGTGDVLGLASADAATLSATSAFEGKISNFEVVKLGATGAANTVDVGNLDDISNIVSAGVTAGGLTLTGLLATNSVKFTGKVDTASSIALASSSGSTDVVNLTLESALDFASGADLTIANVETLNITTKNSSNLDPYTQSIVADAAKTILVTGNVGINLGAGLGSNTKLTSFDASALTTTAANAAVTLTTGALEAAATIIGGAGDDILNASLATKSVTLTGNDGNDTLTGGLAVDTITGGAGLDIITGGALGDTLTGGAGADFFVFGTPLHSNGVNVDTVTDFTVGTDKIVAGGAVTYVGEANGYGAVLTSLAGGGPNRAVLDTSTNSLYIDVNGDANLTVADTVIKLNGITDLSQSDFTLLVTGTTGDDTLQGTAAVETFFGGASVVKDIFKFSNVDTDIDTTAGLVTDSVADFESEGDQLDFTTAGLVTNYTENLTAAASLTDLLTAANTALNGTIQYYFGVVGDNGYLVQDTDGIGYTSVIQLVGVTDIAFGDIV